MTVAPVGFAALSKEMQDEYLTDVHLPDAVVRQIANFVVSEDAPSNVLANLMAMCGVCRQWRMIAREVPPQTPIGFDGLDNAFSTTPLQPAVHKFRRLPADQKQQLFASAARTLTGYSEVIFAGEGITDALLRRAGLVNGSQILKCKVQSAAAVTERGLVSLLTNTRELQELYLEDLSPAITGSFLPVVLGTCRGLRSLHLSGIPGMGWAHMEMNNGCWITAQLTHLHLRGVNLDPAITPFLNRFPGLESLEVDGHPKMITAAAETCTKLQRLSYLVCSRQLLDEALWWLPRLGELRTLELIVKNFTLSSQQLTQIGMLPTQELRIDSLVYKQQPTLNRAQFSHLDNEGVKCLVDSICNRWQRVQDMKPLKLSLCGATGLSHEAVSALLRLPILTELDIGGCLKITAMDKMRLVAKVKAGREMVESGRKPTLRDLRFPGLMLPLP